MYRLTLRILWFLPVVFLVLTWMASPSLAVVGGITDLSEFSDPASSYYGMNWDYNYRTTGGTSTAIGYFTLVTADHYLLKTVDEYPDSYNTFDINGDTWAVASAENLSPSSGQSYQPDIRVLHMTNLTNPYRALPGFYDLYQYEEGNWPNSEKSFVIVGSGDTGSTDDLKYYTDESGTRAMRWGTNRFFGYALTPRSATRYDGTQYSTMVFRMNYNRQTLSTPHESGLGEGDSGCGVFVLDGDEWKLAGLGLYRDTYGTLGYKDFYSASIPTYAEQLYGVLDSLPTSNDNWLANMLPGDLDLDGDVDLYDYITLKTNFGKVVSPWEEGDFNGDGLIGYEELLGIQANLGYDLSLAMVPSGEESVSTTTELLPEPTTLLLLGIGATSLTWRRRRRRISR